MDNISIDTTWMQTSKKLTENITTKFSKENMTSINIHYIYIDAISSIQTISTKKHHLSFIDEKCIISKDKMLQLIITSEKHNDIKYKLSDILLYNIDLESEKAQMSSNISINFLKSQPFYHEIIIPSSLFIFHDINCLYIIYQETDLLHSKKNKTKKMKFKCKNMTKKHFISA
jgi:hypothetical protein